MTQSLVKNAAIKTARVTSRIFGKKIFGHIILFFARAGQIDLLTFAYNRMGILNSENDYVSGESYIIKTFLKSGIRKKSPVMFDVGANRGDYSENLSREFPSANIFAFEPTPTAYQLLTKKLSGTTVKTINAGLGIKKTIQKIYSYNNDAGSPHSSVFGDVLTELHHAKTTKEMEFNCTTIDDFCSENNINYIDFLKIDTEGNELNILRGASKMLAGNNIHYIQFEFNEMNIISRVFLKDFYEILHQYEFYRLSENKLIPLGPYNSTNEIFKFQNILAINNLLNQQLL